MGLNFNAIRKRIEVLEKKMRMVEMPTIMARFFDVSPEGERVHVCGLACDPSDMDKEVFWFDTNDEPIPAYFVSDATLEAIAADKYQSVQTMFDSESPELREKVTLFLRVNSWHVRHVGDRLGPNSPVVPCLDAKGAVIPPVSI